MKRIISIVVVGLTIAGCGTLAEMEAAHEAGSAYLFGRFDEQICELEKMAAKSPQLRYPVPRIVHEVIPPKPQTKTGLLCIVRTEYAPPQAKIRFYGKRVECPATKEEVESWIKTIDDNIAKLKTKLISEKDCIAKGEGNAASEQPNVQSGVSKKSSAVRLSEQSDVPPKEMEVHGSLKKEKLPIAQVKDMLPKFCEVQGVDPSTVNVPRDIEVVELGYASKPYGLRWSSAGIDHQRQIIASNLLKELKGEIPSMVINMEKELTPVFSAIHTNGVLNIDWELCGEMGDKNYKYRKQLFVSRNDLLMIEYERDKIKEELDGITNICAEVNGKSFGPILSICGLDGEKRMVFNKEIFSDILENIIIERVEQYKKDYNSQTLNDFKIKLNDFKQNFPKDHHEMYVEEDWNYGLGVCHFRHKTYYIKELVEFANQYAIATTIIAKEEEKAAARRHLAVEYKNMPEAEKFPLMSVQPKPQMLMKDVPSGASAKWIEGWLADNNAEFGELEKETAHNWMYYKLTGTSPQYTGIDVFKAIFKEEGKPTRRVTFRFKESVLVGVNITMTGSIPSVDQLVEKYSRELGPNAKVERGNNGDPSAFSYATTSVEEVDYFRQVRWFAQDCFVNVANSDVNVRIEHQTFAGLIALSQSTLLMLNLFGAEEQARYLEFDKDGKADLIVRADGSVIRCTSEGKTLKELIAGSSNLANYKRKVENVSAKVVKVEDRKLKSHFDAIRRSKEEAAQKAAEEAKKKAEAAALDF